MSGPGRALGYTIAALQAYFILMNLTVERFYCHAPLKRGDTRFLVPETLDVRLRATARDCKYAELACA